MQVKLDLILVFPSTFNLYGSIWIWEPKSAKTETLILNPKYRFVTAYPNAPCMSKARTWEQD